MADAQVFMPGVYGGMPADVRARFIAKIRVATSGCWEWTASKRPNGYGQFGSRGRPLYAHRVAWESENGPIPPGMFVCHHCDNRGCVNPAHLFIGTHRDNMRDALAKGRLRPARLRGEQCGTSKLTDAQVREIRAQRAARVPVKRVATQFGVNVSTVVRITARATWGHVE